MLIRYCAGILCTLQVRSNPKFDDIFEILVPFPFRIHDVNCSVTYFVHWECL